MSEEYPLMAFIANQGVAPKGDRYDRSALVNDETGKKYKRTEFGDFIYSSNNLETGSIGLNKYGNACISPVYSIFKPTGKADLDFLGRRFLRKDFINEMVKWRQGVVYGQWKIHETDFLNIVVTVPTIEEQKRIGDFLDGLDSLITLHQRKCYRFIDIALDAWEQRKLEEYLGVSKEKNRDESFGKDDVLSVSGEYGIVNQIEFQGRSFAGASVANYGVVEGGDVVYTKSPLKSNPYGIIKTNKGKTGIVSTLYAVYKPKNNVGAEFVQIYFELDSRMNSYMHPLVNKGAKNDMKVSDENALKGSVIFPKIDEQKAISKYFAHLDHLITLHQHKCDELQKLKKFMLQNMFV